jgi:hypothetical protein
MFSTDNPNPARKCPRWPQLASRARMSRSSALPISDNAPGPEGFSERRQVRTVPATLEQAAAKHRFKRCNLLAKRGLADMQCVGGAAEMAHYFGNVKNARSSLSSIP